MTGLLEFRILGPLEAHVGGQLVRLGGARQRSLLAALLIEAGRTQSLDRLAHAVWADEQPESVRTQIAIRVHGLRKAFRAAGCDAPVIVTEKYGYRLATDVAWVDAEEAGALTTRARTLAAAGDVDDAATLYGRALALWRGSALAELDSAAITTAGRGLDDTRLEVAERWADLELARGRPREVVSRLAALVEEHPLREGLRERLMLALSRAGRQADALESYRQGRELLLEELGLEPGDGLREAHQAVLRGMEEPAEPVHAVGRPAQLPPAVQGFVGRQEQLGLLDGLLEDAPYLPVAVVSGVAGVGKTSLALAWAHRVADRFPDGQLFADLRGYSPCGDPADPPAVLERFLRALGVPGASVPPCVEERGALLRSLLSGRRVLLVLDNAESAAQVRPLLPGAPGCAVVITSRRRLEGLMVDDGARAVPLGVLTGRESSALLGRVAGADRVRVEHAQAVRLAELCDGLPLALRIAAAKLAARPGWSLRELADRLADERHRLDQLSRDELEVRGSIELSYRELPHRAALAFRLLGSVDAPSGFAPWMTAALLDTSLEEGEALLEDLVDAQLLQVLGRDPAGQPRYRFHDLIRLYARELAEDADEQPEALNRLFGALLALAEQARSARFESYPRVPMGRAPRWLPEPEPLRRLLSDPLAWSECERATLVAAVEQCARLGLDRLCWNLVASFVTVYETRSCYDDWERVARRALAACEAAGDLEGQAAMRSSLGALWLNTRRLHAAEAEMAGAIELFDRLGDHLGRAIALRHLGTVYVFRGELDRGERALAEAMRVFEEGGDLAGLAHGLGYVSHVHMLRGELEAAARVLDRALSVNPGNQLLEAQLLKRQAEVYRRQGRPVEAIGAARRALTLTSDLGDVIGQAYVLHALGEAWHEAGEPGEAEAALDRALGIARQVGDRLVEGRVLLALGHVRDPGCFRQAADAFAAIGARGWYAQAVEEGARPAV